MSKQSSFTASAARITFGDGTWCKFRIADIYSEMVKLGNSSLTQRSRIIITPYGLITFGGSPLRRKSKSVSKRAKKVKR